MDHPHHHHHLLRDIAIAGAIGLGAYELYHYNRYGNFGFGNPYNNGMNFGGYGSPYGYGGDYGYGGPPAPYY